MSRSKDKAIFIGLVRLEKASNVARDLFSDYDYSQKYKNILVKTACSIYAQQYSRKSLWSFFKMAAISNMKITSLIVFSKLV